MTRRPAQNPEYAVRGTVRSWPPTCVCGFTGEANDRQTPYVYCGDPHDASAPRDPARHQRPPVAAQYRTRPPEPVPAVTPLRTRTSKPGGPRRVALCPVCECEFALRPNSWPPVMAPHGPVGQRCRGGGEMPTPSTVRDLP